jgi:hypothetical protein
VNPALLLPSALLALTALILPLLIHLSRRSEQKPTAFAALRWISAQLRPRRKLVFQEILLLLLRLLLLIMLAVFLAKPVSMYVSSGRHWVVVIPGADISAIQDQANNKNGEWHWLSPGFPGFENAPNSVDIPVSSLLRELDAQLPLNTKLTVIAPEQLAGLDGERIRLSRQVDWKIVPGKMPPVVAQKKTRPIRLAIRYEEAQAGSIRYFRAAHSVWQAERKVNEKDVIDIGTVSASLKEDRTALIWLATGKLPMDIREWVRKGGTAIISKEAVTSELTSSVAAWRNADGKTLARIASLGQGHLVQWQQTVSPEAMPELLDASFPQHLKDFLQTSRTTPNRALAKSQAPLAGIQARPELPQSMQPWFALLIALLFMLERWLANTPHRWRTA